jgi:hypothetical protein
MLRLNLHSVDAAMLGLPPAREMKDL